MIDKNSSYAVKKFGKTPQGLLFLEQLQVRISEFKAAGLGDADFESQLYRPESDTFFSRYWELTLAEKLQESGLSVSSQPIGPDFMTNIEGHTVWFEATSPRPEGLQNYLKKHCCSVPHREILLRITSAIRDKVKKFRDYIKKGIVGISDINIIAIDVTQLGIDGNTGISQGPTIIEAVYPVGPIAIKLNTDTMKPVDSYTSYRPRIEKTTQTTNVQVNTDNFLTDTYYNISAVLSGLSCFSHTTYTLVHNFKTLNPLHPKKFNVDKEYIAIVKQDYLELTDIAAIE